MSDAKTASWIAALERARTELEGALSADDTWRRRGAGRSDANRAAYERELGGNPVYLCWLQVNEAIEKLRREIDVGAWTEAGATTARRRASLRDVLEHIRGDAALPRGCEPQAAAADGRRSEPSEEPPSGPEPPSTANPAGAAMPPAGTAHASPEAEEATVSFVIRERAPPASPAGQGGDASAQKEPVPHEAGAAKEPEDDLGTEAEVVIVPRRR